MRILILDTYYVAFLAEHYRTRPGLGERPYAEQMQTIMDRCFGTSDAYSHHLKELGHDAAEVIPNCAPLQARWAREHGARLTSRLRSLTELPRIGAAARWRLLRTVLERQIAEYDPQVVYVQDLGILDDGQARAIRDQGRLLVAQVGCWPPPTEVLTRYDFLVTSFPHYVDRFRALGVDTEYFGIGFYDRVLDRLGGAGSLKEPGDGRRHDAVFVGTVHPPDVHRAGTALLERLATDAGVEFWGQIADELDSRSPILSHHHGEAWGLDMYKLLADARITINRHGDVAERNANNMRLYEATGVGSMLLTEQADNLSELFEPGREVVPYDGPDDLVEKVRHYVANPDEAAAIAAAGQQRTLRDHTYRRRMEQLAAMLEARLK